VDSAVDDENLEIVFGVDLVVELESDSAVALDGDIVEKAHLGEVEVGVDQAKGRLTGLGLILVDLRVVLLIVSEGAGLDRREQGRQQLEEALKSFGVLVQKLRSQVEGLLAAVKADVDLLTSGIFAEAGDAEAVAGFGEVIEAGLDLTPIGMVHANLRWLLGTGVVGKGVCGTDCNVPTLRSVFEGRGVR
jgi:hypothetical protein